MANYRWSKNLASVDLERNKTQTKIILIKILMNTNDEV